MNGAAIEKQAAAMAAKAKPGISNIGGKVYTLVFDHAQWVYNVYEDGFWLVNFNAKSLRVAKQYLSEYLES